MRMLALLTALLLAFPPPARAIFRESTAGATAQFLRIGAGARALGMGDAYGPIAEGPNAIYWNPAGIAAITSPQVEYSHIEMLSLFHHDYLAFAQPVPLLRGTLGVAITVFYQESIPLVTNTNERLGSFGGHSESIALAYGKALQIGERYADRDRGYFENFYHLKGADLPLYHEDELWEGNLLLGGSVKFVQETLHTNSARAFAFDGGALFRHARFPQTSWSFTLRNIGTKARFIREYEPLPAEFDFGVAHDFRWGPRGGHRLLPAFEIAAPLFAMPFAKLGIEYTFPITLEHAGMVRLGYKSQPAIDLNPLAGLTGGVGVRLGQLSVDFGFQPMAELGEIYRIGVGYKFH